MASSSKKPNPFDLGVARSPAASPAASPARSPAASPARASASVHGGRAGPSAGTKGASAAKGKGKGPSSAGVAKSAGATKGASAGATKGAGASAAKNARVPTRATVAPAKAAVPAAKNAHGPAKKAQGSTPESQAKSLQGHVRIAPVHWVAVRYGTFIKYIGVDGGLRSGGFVVKNNFSSASQTFVLQSGFATGAKSWTVRYEHIAHLYARPDAVDVTTRNDLRQTIKTLNGNNHSLANYARDLERRITALEARVSAIEGRGHNRRSSTAQ